MDSAATDGSSTGRIGVVQHGQVAVPQTLLIREYFQAANRIDIHNQYRQGLLAIERTWKTKSWELRIFQTVMGMTLVNGYLAFQHITGRETTLRDFVKQPTAWRWPCVPKLWRWWVGVATQGARQAKDSQVDRGDPGDLPHALFNGRALGLRASQVEVQCRLCMDKHASGICKTCSTGVCKTCSTFVARQPPTQSIQHVAAFRTRVQDQLTCALDRVWPSIPPRY